MARSVWTKYVAKAFKLDRSKDVRVVLGMVEPLIRRDMEECATKAEAAASTPQEVAHAKQLLARLRCVKCSEAKATGLRELVFPEVRAWWCFPR